MAENKDFVYREKDAGHKELFSMLIYRPIAKAMLMSIFRHINTTPNQITFFSLVLTIIGCWFFAFKPYPSMMIGILFLHLGYAFDMMDGQYARYKGLSSKFGQWFDPFLDVIKAAFLFISLSYAGYVAESDPNVLIWGLIALTHCFLTYYIMNTRNLIIKGHTFEIKLRNNIYVGYEISLYWALTFIVLINKIYPGLIFLGTVGALSWIKVYVTLRRYYIRNREEVEKNL